MTSSAFRIGQGYDVHALVAGRDLILGGVKIAHDKGLLGHSDADALLHAITDALLGAAALGDIGRHFPDTDDRYKGADSRVLLRATMSLLQAAGYSVGNVDATIICQTPKWHHTYLRWLRTLPVIWVLHPITSMSKPKLMKSWVT